MDFCAQCFQLVLVHDVPGKEDHIPYLMVPYQINELPVEGYSLQAGDKMLSYGLLESGFIMHAWRSLVCYVSGTDGYKYHYPKQLYEKRYHCANVFVNGKKDVAICCIAGILCVPVSERKTGINGEYHGNK